MSPSRAPKRGQWLEGHTQMASKNLLGHLVAPSRPLNRTHLPHLYMAPWQRYWQEKKTNKIYI